MAAIEGFELTLNAGDVDVAAGSVDGVHVDAATVSTDTGSAEVGLIVVESGAIQTGLVALSAQTEAQTVVGSATGDGADTLSAPELAHRGRNAPVSADE